MTPKPIEKIFKIPESCLNGILSILGEMKFKDIASVMAEINKIIQPQMDNQGGKDN